LTNFRGRSISSDEVADDTSKSLDELKTEWVSHSADFVQFVSLALNLRHPNLVEFDPCKIKLAKFWDQVAGDPIIDSITTRPDIQCQNLWIHHGLSGGNEPSPKHVNLYRYRPGIEVQSVFCGIFGVLLSFDGWAIFFNPAVYFQSPDHARGVFDSIGINCSSAVEKTRKIPPTGGWLFRPLPRKYFR
jgi:hypothetical protein